MVEFITDLTIPNHYVTGNMKSLAILVKPAKENHNLVNRNKSWRTLRQFQPP